MSSKPGQILIVDDRDDSTFEVLLQNESLKASTHVPSSITDDDVRMADVVLVDYQLDLWPERDAADFSLRPRDGLALASLLRRQIHDAQKSSPTAFAIRTGNMRDLASPLPSESRSHVLARINNLEWVFDKTADATTSVKQVKSLAEAMRSLPKDWPSSSSDAQQKMCDLLSLDSESYPNLLNDVLDCLPPLHAMSQWSHGLAFLRWILHRILPYPCFLFDDHHLAARLRISLSSFREICTTESNPIAKAQYSGILSKFLGDRWWRGAIEQQLWEATDGDTLDGVQIRKWLSESTGVEVLPSESDDFPVVCLDESHASLDVTHPMSECVRIQPDDWPAFAEQAWTTIELAKELPALASLVRSADRRKLA